jgi:phosphatidylserine/phosphatidylglycerophosphate/cardiolipin synthase-like enzyme/uncharacterized membrane protein YdjX (TVP38/TMEM64 family)
LFSEGRNCWRATQAACASVVVDCGNYYRDLYESICKAKHSIFVLGWDIDSRIELIRGERARGLKCPPVFFDLIQAKAAENPELMIYLNRWNYSLFFAQERESFSEFRWRRNSPENIHFCLDSAIPNGGCHHQKVVVVDDEVAYCGGMDVALGRWDFRDHHTWNPNRVDPGGGFHAHDRVSFGPYHDIQMAVSGPAAAALAELVRDRWRIAAGYDPVPLRKTGGVQPPPTWPDSDPPDFYDVSAAIALTRPPMLGAPPLHQAERLYLDMIAAAENFIYIENQFLTHEPLAEALNRRLHEKPGLRALLVSCDLPHGVMEKKAMWTARTRFRDILERGGLESRAVIATPVSIENGETAPVRVHSKAMIVDDRYLRIGSSNLSTRAMRLDTECDLVLEGRDAATRARIARVRTDLIREHSGHEAGYIDQAVDGGQVAKLLEIRPGSRQHLIRVNDDAFRDEALASLARKVADPGGPFIPPELTIPNHYPGTRRNWSFWLFSAMPAFLTILGLALMWKFTPAAIYADPAKLAPLMAALKASPGAALAVVGVMALAEYAMFPLVVMNAGAAAAFGASEGFALSMIAAMITAAMGFGTGRLMGMRLLRLMTGSVVDRVDNFIRRGGILSMAVLRSVPIAPFNAVNLGLGISRVTFGVYMAGTFLGLAPGTLVTSLAGHSLAEFWRHPDARSLGLVALAALCWVVVVTVIHFLVRRWQDMYFRGRRA